MNDGKLFESGVYEGLISLAIPSVKLVANYNRF